MSGTLDHWGGGSVCLAGPGPAVRRGGSRDLGSGESEGLGPPRAVLGPGDVPRQGVERGTGLQPVGTCQSVDRDPVGGITASRAQYRLRPVQGSLVRACLAPVSVSCVSLGAQHLSRQFVVPPDRSGSDRRGLSFPLRSSPPGRGPTHLHVGRRSSLTLLLCVSLCVKTSRGSQSLCLIAARVPEVSVSPPPPPSRSEAGSSNLSGCVLRHLSKFVGRECPH